jgi:hypothetical protein
MPTQGGGPTDDLLQFFDALRRVVKGLYPSEEPDSIQIRLRGRPCPVTLPVPPAPPAAPPSAPPAAPTDPPPGPAPPYRHNEDYTSCHRNGTDHAFSAEQARVMRVLWESWEDGTPVVRQEAALERAESEAGRLRDVFRHHPAWGTWVVSAGPGCFRLAD